MGPEHVHWPSQSLLHGYWSQKYPFNERTARECEESGAWLQARNRSCRPHGKWAMESEVRVRLGLPSWHRWKDDSDRKNVSSGPDEHDHHRLHDDLLPDHTGCAFLAVDKPVLQCRGQLHQQKRWRSPHCEWAGNGLCFCNHWRCGNGPRTQCLNQACLPTDRTFCSLRCCSCC